MRLLLPLLALVLVGSCAPAEEPDLELPPDVVLVLVDTLRADRLGCYGGPRPTSPHLDRLAAAGARFDSARAPSPWTLPSSASLLTGLSPERHGAGLEGPLRDLGSTRPAGLRDDATTLAELLADRGYRTSAFVTNPYLTFGLDRGFDEFEHEAAEGADVAAYGQARLGRDDTDRPLFLLLHFMDVHDPLLVPDQDALAVATDGESLPEIWARTFPTLPATVEGRDERLLAYDAAVHYVDRQLGRVLEAVEDRGRPTLVVFTSDHGEELFEHAALAREAGHLPPGDHPVGLGHGHALFEELLRVPLVMSGPGIPAGHVVPGLAALEDLTPTLLELVDPTGVAPPTDGHSLVPALTGDAAPRPTMAAGDLAYGPDRRAWITPRWKLVRGGPGEPPLLFDLAADPAEATDLASAHPEVVAELGAALEAHEAANPHLPGAGQTSTEHDDRLDALGY